MSEGEHEKSAANGDLLPCDCCLYDLALYIVNIYSSLYLLHNHVDILIADMIQVTFCLS